MRPSYYHPPKPVERPDNISVLIPTRGHPEALQKVFENFQATIERKSLLDVWLYVDDDDAVTLDYIKSDKWKKYDLSINWNIDRCTGSMGEMFNKLWQNCATNPGIYFPFPDDYLIATPNWDAMLRDSFSRHSDGIMLGFLPDPTAKPYQVTFAIPSAKWLNILGYFITNRFYYWFDDMWLDEIANMVNRKVMIPIVLDVPGGKGKTPRMRNLPFWCAYFSNTLKERFHDASKILSAIYKDDKAAFDRAHLQAMQVAAELMHKSYLYNDSELKLSEELYRDYNATLQGSQIINYIRSELYAIEDLFEMLNSEISAGNHTDIIELTKALNKSVFYLPDTSYLEAKSLDNLGFHSDALIALQKEIAGTEPERKTIDLASQLIKKTDLLAGSYEKSLSCLRLPAWITVDNAEIILFPDKADHELYFTIQRILYFDDSIRTILDVGAGDGSGTTDAVITAIKNKQDVRVFCIEADVKKFDELKKRLYVNATCYKGSSVAINDYMTLKATSLFYKHIPTITNYYSLDTVLQQRQAELNNLLSNNLTDSAIDEIKASFSLSAFDFAILDGSMFTGEADLNAVYGSKYIVLNSVRSIKNYANIIRLNKDPDYCLIDGNIESRCGYAIYRMVDHK
ncbi:MAG: hypothetical protein PHY09_03535 [Desulfuromonadaceae bacterium]|nr:hypothetical protein [Desulfuromonadaceae bacterium]MDD5104178.1 hypothetical protein [Desulfuromonadaceae bacterium]